MSRAQRAINVMPLVLGKYFSPDEMRCRDGMPYPGEFTVRWAVLVSQLDAIRAAWGGPLVIVSGYRTKEHNQAVGGAEQSQHPEGRAADLRPFYRDRRPTKEDILALDACVEKLIAAGKLPAVGGVGVYPLVKDAKSKLWVAGWVHVDTRPKPHGHIARWKGQGFGDESLV